MLFSSEYHSFEKKQQKKLQINTEQNETKQKEIKKEKGCGYWDIAAFGKFVFF